MIWGVSAQNCFVFSKICFFPKFWSIEPIFRSIEITIKNFGQSLSISIDAWLILDQSKHFRSIEPNFWLIENHIESFLKHLILTCSNIFSKSFQTLSLSIRSVKGRIKIFCRFPSFFLQGSSPLRPVRHFYPSFCIYLHVPCIKSCDLGKISNLRIFGVFDDSTCFSWNWSMSFCSKTLYNCSWWFNLINLLFCEKLKFLGIETTWIGDFVQIKFNW